MNKIWKMNTGIDRTNILAIVIAIGVVVLMMVAFSIVFL